MKITLNGQNVDLDLDPYNLPDVINSKSDDNEQLRNKPDLTKDIEIKPKNDVLYKVDI